MSRRRARRPEIDSTRRANDRTFGGTKRDAAACEQRRIGDGAPEEPRCRVRADAARRTGGTTGWAVVCLMTLFAAHGALIESGLRGSRPRDHFSGRCGERRRGEEPRRRDCQHRARKISVPSKPPHHRTALVPRSKPAPHRGVRRSTSSFRFLACERLTKLSQFGRRPNLYPLWRNCHKVVPPPFALAFGGASGK